MTFRTRAILLALATVLVLLPFAVLHPLVVHLDYEGEIELRRGLLSPGFIALVLIATAGTGPLLGVISVCLTLRGSHRSIVRLRAAGEPRTVEGVDYLRVSSPQPAILTVGFWQPAIIVSSGAEASLSDAELRAALLHERAHQQRRDVLWRALLVAVTKAFGAFPPIGTLVAESVLRSECLADDDALANGANRKALFEALVVIGGAHHSTLVPLSASLADCAVEYRLLRIARREARLPASPSKGLGGLTLALVALPVAAHLLVFVGLVCGS